VNISDVLLPRQLVAAEWLAGRNKALLGDAPRVGKTRPLLYAAALIGAERPVVICPAIVRTHWRREAETLAPFGVTMPWVWSYDELVARGDAEREKILRGLRPDVLILDEAHYLKSPTSKRAKLILGKSGYAKRIPRVWAATGTPMPKHPGELWNLLVSLFPEEVIADGFRTREEFEEHFCIRVKRQAGRGSFWKVLGVKNHTQLEALLSRIMLRRTLPADGLQWQTLILDGSGKTWFADPETAMKVQRAIATDTLEQIAGDPEVTRMRRLLGEYKAGLAVTHIREMLENEPDAKVAVFAHHHSVLDALEAGLQEFGLVRVDGTTTQALRTRQIDRFQQEPPVRVFLGQSIACMTGITLDAADTAFLVEPDWTAVVNQQVGNRIMNYRDGRPRTVQVVHLAGTLDEGIGRLNGREVRMQGEVGL
jgi:SWI/SNF-related matrix-associated actin-dependent regulator 1 of chromatin subfamily A